MGAGGIVPRPEVPLLKSFNNRVSAGCNSLSKWDTLFLPFCTALGFGGALVTNGDGFTGVLGVGVGEEGRRRSWIGMFAT